MTNDDIQSHLPAAREKAWTRHILDTPLDFFYDLAEGFTSDRDLEDLAVAIAKNDVAAVGRLIIHSLDSSGVTATIEDEAHDIASSWATYGDND